MRSIVYKFAILTLNSGYCRVFFEKEMLKSTIEIENFERAILGIVELLSSENPYW